MQLVQSQERAEFDYVISKARFAAASDREKPGHTVVLTHPFYMGKFTVTQAQYNRLIGKNPSSFKGKDNPVDDVSWDDAQAFCKKLTLTTNREARLPTEAEWEFACRAGTQTTFSSGDTIADLARVAWYPGNSAGGTHPVGQKLPNAFGLYDMHGNIWQWCQDWYDEDYYQKREIKNPRGPAKGDSRVLRGGSWDFPEPACHSTFRESQDPQNTLFDVGFRVTVEIAVRTP